MERKNYPALSGIRFLFIMMIVFYHTWPMVGAIQPGKVALFFRANGGNWGNYMFFMISGFLMTVHYKAKLSDDQSRMPLHVFLLKRLLKLYPLYFITMCASILFNLNYSGLTYVNFKEIIFNTLMLSTGYVEELNQYNSPQWFACVLMLCYLIFYVLCYLARKNRRVFTYGAVLLMFWGYILLSRSWSAPFCYPKNGEGYFNFFLGCLIAEFLQAESVTTHVKKGVAITAGVLSVLFFVAAYFKGFDRLSGDGRYVLSLLICPAILMLAVMFKWTDIAFGNRVMSALGKLSTAIFFWHIPLYQHLYFNRYQRGEFFNDASHFVRLVVYLAILGALCVISYILIEKKLGNYLSKKLNTLLARSKAAQERDT